jgi:hypothetical protein
MSSADEPALIDFMQIAGRFSRCLDNVFFTSPMSESGQTEKDRSSRGTSGEPSIADLFTKRVHSRSVPETDIHSACSLPLPSSLR